MNEYEAHSLLDSAENQLQSTARGVAFETHTNATRGLASWYENQFANATQKPLIVFNQEQNLYYFLFGPRQTPQQRNYPVRLTNGQLTEAQPEYYYNTTQAVDYTRIMSVVDPYNVSVDLSGMVSWPANPPYYLYLCQKAAIEDYETYRYVKIGDRVPKVKVLAVNGNVLTLDTEITIDDPETNFYFLVFFNYPIDDKIEADLTLFIGDQTFREVVLGDATPDIRSEVPPTEDTTLALVPFDTKSVWIAITDSFDTEEVLISTTFAVPTINKKMLILKRNENTILKYDEIKVALVMPWANVVDTPIYEDDASIVLSEDGRFVEDQFEETTDRGEDVIGDDDPRIIVGHRVTTYYNIVLDKNLPNLNEGDELAYYELAERVTSEMSDDELSIPVPGTEWSLRPHNAHMLYPLRALAYASVYGNNWAAPLPYAEETAITDSDQPIVNGYLTPKVFPSHRMSYDRYRGVWAIAAHDIFPSCRNLADSHYLTQCIINTRLLKYLKLEHAAQDGSDFYPMYMRQWK